MQMRISCTAVVDIFCRFVVVQMFRMQICAYAYAHAYAYRDFRGWIVKVSRIVSIWEWHSFAIYWQPFSWCHVIQHCVEFCEERSDSWVMEESYILLLHRSPWLSGGSFVDNELSLSVQNDFMTRRMPYTHCHNMTSVCRTDTCQPTGGQSLTTLLMVTC